MSNDFIKKLIKKKSQKSVLRVYKHLYELNDTSLIILKGHLLVEEEINELLDVLLNKPIALKNGDFNFFQKFCILQAVIDPQYLSQKDWQAIKQLNNLRNKLAHNLEPKGIKDIVRNFLDKCDPEIKREKVWQDGPDEKRLIISISMLCGKLIDTHVDIVSP